TLSQGLSVNAYQIASTRPAPSTNDANVSPRLWSGAANIFDTGMSTRLRHRRRTLRASCRVASTTNVRPRETRTDFASGSDRSTVRSANELAVGFHATSVSDVTRL